MQQSWPQFARFLIGGGLNTAFTYAAFLLLNLFIEAVAAYTIVYILGIAISYLLNTYFVFKARSTLSKALRFPVVYIIQYILGVAILSILLEYGFDSHVAMLGVIFVSVPVTFLISRAILKN
ncbi:GtrA family protein [Microvirga lenta]|uniref:GtrA family protein n=1 Tax=Microvirga lenta TaxID=2881337 RepID=UPI001CFF85C4|nr:GtrA family protein [Microvirga lenta]